MEFKLIAPSVLQRQLNPCKRLLGILLRPTCVSIAISSSHPNLADPVGAILLRSGRVPERTLLRLLSPYQSEVTGVVFGSESNRQLDALLASTAATDTLRQIHGVLHSVAPDLPGAWWDRWTPDTPASCRLPGPAQPASVSSAADTTEGGEVSAVPLEGGHAAAAVLGAGGSGVVGRPAGSPGFDASKKPADGAPCSMGTLFLQHYLDSMREVNTFG